MKLLLIGILLSATYFTPAEAHEGKKHKKDSVVSEQDSLIYESELHQHEQRDTVYHHEDGMKPNEAKVTAELADFPSLHPLIVHFAIALIIVAAALQLLNVILLRKEIAWIIAVILSIGCASAWLASTKYHPHTHGITEHAKLVLEQHDNWADWTNQSALVGLVLQIVYLVFISIRRVPDESPANNSHALWKYRKIASVVVGVVLALSAYSVSRAGHYGAQLVHIEGIGPQGKYLEMDHHH